MAKHTANPVDFLLFNTKVDCVYHNKGVCAISTNDINLFCELHPAFEGKAERNNIKDTKRNQSRLHLIAVFNWFHLSAVA